MVSEPSMAKARNALWSWIAALSALLFHAANGLVFALMARFPTSLDELQHLSYIRWMERAPRLFPRYQDLRVLDVTGRHFTSAANYLNHPSPYYLLMGPLDRAFGGSALDLRLVNLSLSLCAGAFILWAGYRVLDGWRERAVFAAALVLFPKLGVDAGLINNDNAALLATGVGFLGLIEWQRRPSDRTALLLSLGVVLCGWTKLTVLLMLGFSVLIAEGLRLWSAGKRPGIGGYAILSAGFLVAAAPSLANIAAYGRVLHHSSAFYVQPAQRVSLSAARYGAVFLQNMAIKWSALEPSSLQDQLGLYLVLILAAVTIVVGVRQLRRGAAADQEPDAGAAWRTACAMILATAPVLLLHLYFGWRTFVEDGFIDMAQDRYYYGVWPGFALGFALVWRASQGRVLRTPVTIVSAALLVWSSVAFAGVVLLAHGQTTMG
jgi:hypothetical protein